MFHIMFDIFRLSWILD